MATHVKLDMLRLKHAITSFLGVTEQQWFDLWTWLKRDGTAITIYTDEQPMFDYASFRSKPVRCVDHPRYQVKRRPRTGCEVCWLLWLVKLDERHANVLGDTDKKAA